MLSVSNGGLLRRGAPGLPGKSVTCVTFVILLGNSRIYPLHDVLHVRVDLLRRGEQKGEQEQVRETCEWTRKTACFTEGNGGSPQMTRIHANARELGGCFGVAGAQFPLSIFSGGREQSAAGF